MDIFFSFVALGLGLYLMKLAKEFSMPTLTASFKEYDRQLLESLIQKLDKQEAIQKLQSESLGAIVTSLDSFVKIARDFVDGVSKNVSETEEQSETKTPKVEGDEAAL